MANDISNLDLMLGKSGRESAPIPDRAATEAEIEDFKARVLAKLALERRQGR